LKDAKRPGAKYPFKGESGLRKSQITWMTEECDKGGKVLLALQCGDRVYLLKADLYFDELHRMTEEDISRVASTQWVKGSKRGKSSGNKWGADAAIRALLEDCL